MNSNLEQLIEALREELTQYGEMLALLEQQQEYVINNDTTNLLNSIDTIGKQTYTINNVRSKRDTFRAQLCREFGLQEESSFAELLNKLPLEYKLLLNALIEENNTLLLRIQMRARQNHLLLKKSIELIQDLISTLMPAQRINTYNKNGGFGSDTEGKPSFYSSIC